jgi:ribosomal protein RSM22 (predicted rRNA methylase)
VQAWPSLTRFTLIEADRVMAAIGSILAEGSPLEQADWRHQSVESASMPRSDIVIASYMLNELAPPAREALIQRAFAAADQALVLIEAGTPAGFGILRDARKTLLNSGAGVIAPCMHEGPCPITGSDWCHFAAPVARSPAHKLAKGVGASLETEKFAYLAVAPHPRTAQAQARIVRRPMHRSGHVVLDLCSANGLSRQPVSRRDGALYRASRDTAWGDPWPPDST